jgi:hypothetical protein
LILDGWGDFRRRRHGLFQSFPLTPASLPDAMRLEVEAAFQPAFIPTVLAQLTTWIDFLKAFMKVPFVELIALFKEP